MKDPELERMAAMRRELLMKSKVPLNFGTFPDPRQDDREWWVISTTLAQIWLVLTCAKTGAQGVIKDPDKEEWCDAFYAPSKPYQWHDNSRVTLMKEGFE